MPTELSFLQIDAFASKPFQGNPAVVVAPGDPISDTLMQQIAAEMNVSETCFLVSRDNGYHLRWFTPSVEVDLCGHATLAAAHALWEGWGIESEYINFQSLSGQLQAVRHEGMIWLNFPSERVEELSMPDRLAAAMPGSPVWVGKNRLDYLLEYSSETEVRDLRPDFSLLCTLGARGVIATAAASSTTDADFVSRYFAPGAGIDEDPVTGSTHCALGPYWGRRMGKTRLRGLQASNRTGYVDVRVDNDRTHLGGKAVIVARGTLSV